MRLLARWFLVSGALAGLLVALLAALPRPAEATDLCASTGSPKGPFNLETYEAADWRTTYARSLELASLNRLYPELASFATPRLQTGPRSAGSGQLRDPYIPPTLLKSIAWLESSWVHADWSVPYGSVGPVLVSHDCGYGIMQVTTGMQNVSGLPNLDQAMIGGHFAFNMARGARILADKWNIAPESRPQVGSRNVALFEDWYYAVWGYNGFAFKNHPLNSDYSSSRTPYSCGPSNDGYGHDRSRYPYQELVLGCVTRPPVISGTPLWTARSVHLPKLSEPAFAGPLSVSNWDACAVYLNCAAMDMPTPNPSNQDPTTTNLTRSQVIGAPKLSLSTTSLSLISVPPAVTGSSTVTVGNSGSGAMSWRATASASWLKVSRYQGTALGSDLGNKSSTLTIRAETGGLAPGKYTAKVTLESPASSSAPATINVTVQNYPDGTLVQASGTGVYVVMGGLKRGIPNPVTFEANGFDWAKVLFLPPDDLAAIATGDPLLDVRADGNLLNGSGPEVYVMQGGSKRHVVNPEVMAACDYGFDASHLIPDSRLAAIPSGAALTGPPCPLFVPPSGALVAGTGPEVYVMRGGLRRHIPNAATLEGMGFRRGNINLVADSSLSSIPQGDPLLNLLDDGNLLQGSGPEVYVMQGGQKRHITSREVLEGCGYGWDSVHYLPDSRLDSIAAGAPLTAPPCPMLVPASGVLLQGSGAEIYVMQSGIRRHIPNGATLEGRGFRSGNINVVADSSLAQITEGQRLLSVLADGNLIHGPGPEIYVMQDGMKHHVAGRSVMSACGYPWDNIYTLSESRLGSIPAGPALSGPPCPQLSFADGTLLNGSGDEIFVVQAGTKRHVASRDAMTACGYLWGNINAVADNVLSKMATGDSLSGPPCP